MQDFKTLKRIIYQIYNILSRRQRIQMLGVFLVLIIGSGFELLGVSAMLPFIQSILTPEELMRKRYIQIACSFLNIQTSFGTVILVGVGIVCVYIIKNLYLTFSAYIQALYSNNTQKELSVLMMRAYMRSPYSFFVEHGSGEIMRGVNGDIGGVFQVVQNGFKLLSEVLVICSVAIYLLAIDFALALGVLLIGFLCLVLVVFGLKKRISRMSSLYRDASVRMYNSVSQISGGIKDIFVFERQSYFLRKFENAYDGLRIVGTYNDFVNNIPERLIEAMCVSGIIITVLIRLGMGDDPKLFVPKMAVFAMGAFRLLPSISRSAGYINAFVYNREWVESAYENVKSANLLNDEKVDTEPFCSEKTKTKKKFRDKVELMNIQWKYPESKANVLENITFHINKGEVVGIIGESGSGKSTLADILLRLYTPLKGSILMDGVNIETIHDDWMETIGYVPQNVFLIDDTIRENVLFGSDNVDDAFVWESLKKASLDEFVMRLPQGLNTVVGERGVKFSGGQRQRIAIARALYNNPQILILDEATSALDNETEEAVMEAIDALAGSMTLIIIAHRVSTLKNCDRIYEIVEGKAVERNKEMVLTGV